MNETAETKTCQSCKLPFHIEPDDFSFYEKMKVPPPTFCPECRLKRRFIWRNERTLYRRKDDFSGNDMFAGFAPDVPFPVYERDYWWSDKFDALAYGRDYDFSRPFFEQYRELMLAVPEPSRSVLNLVNSDYVDQAGDAKNCYLCFNVDIIEDCAYLVRALLAKETYDSLQIHHSEVVYDSVLLEKCFRMFYSTDCESSTDMWFSRDCVGCTDCFGCVSLRKKSYYIFNQPYSKEDYFKKIKEFNLGSRASVKELRKQAEAFWLQFPARYYHGIRNVGSSGDMMNDTKNTRQSWATNQSEDVRYCQAIYSKISDAYDYTVWGMGADRIYETLTCGMEISDLKFCFECWPSCKNLDYCIACHSSSDLFGCVGLKKAQYCIFNKQYSKEDYFLLRAKIIEQMNSMPYISKNAATGAETIYRYGEFFPVEFSPFAYNETMMQDAFPLTKEAALAAGYAWRENEVKEFKVTLPSESVPDTIEEVTESIAKEIIECATCKRAYRIIPAEFQFYKKIGIPLPDQCPNCRIAGRFKYLNKPVFYVRNCMCAGAAAEGERYKNNSQHFHEGAQCPNSFETAYPASSPYFVYCEQCYNAEIV